MWIFIRADVRRACCNEFLHKLDLCLLYIHDTPCSTSTHKHCSRLLPPLTFAEIRQDVKRVINGTFGSVGVARTMWHSGG